MRTYQCPCEIPVGIRFLFSRSSTLLPFLRKRFPGLRILQHGRMVQTP